jgi:tRNA(fMet)-specific endonuclease VapC
MKYLLDTNICIYLIKQHPNIEKKLKVLSPGDIGISSVTLSELYYGVEKSQYVERNRRALEKFILPIEIFDFGVEASETYGKFRNFLERKGTSIGSMDLMIAAHAFSLNVTIITNNEREFRRIPDLKIENWFK